jgi:NADH-quinone oxidoreductase subunit J
MSVSLVLFFILAIATAMAALAVVFTRDIVRSAVWLLFTLIGVSLTYFLLGAEFLGAAQLIIYVGGTMVLVVFGVMLTAQGSFLRLKTPRVEWGAGIALAAALFGLIVHASLEFSQPARSPSSGSVSVTAIGAAFLGVPSGPHKIGYLLPFEIVSVHLLVALIGAAYLARAKRRRPVPDAKERADG